MWEITLTCDVIKSLVILKNLKEWALSISQESVNFYVISFAQYKSFLDYFFSTLDELSYHNIADETLDALAELFEDLGESPSSPTDYDVQLSVS